MNAPVHIYYILTDFYQNYIRYVRSVSYDQLHGNPNKGLNDCEPQKELNVNKDNLTSFPNDARINPCGLTAWSLFNDTFTNFEVRSLVPMQLTLEFAELSGCLLGLSAQ
jgi:hypothetical protein